MREQAQLPTPAVENDKDMDVSSDNSLFSEPTTKATSTNYHSRTPNSTIHSTSQMPTPPLTVVAPAPILLDPVTKTAQIIAQIKERANAKLTAVLKSLLLNSLTILTTAKTISCPFYLSLPNRPGVTLYATYQTKKGNMFFFSSSKDNTLSTAVFEDAIRRSSLFITKSFSGLVIVEFQSLIRNFKRIALKKMSFATKSCQGSHRKRE